MSTKSQTQQGFSILEALVSMALIAGAFLPLLLLQGQLTRTAIAIERSEQVLRVETNALSYLQTLNPSLRPEGQEPMGEGVTLTWQSAAVTTPRPIRSMNGENGRFDITLYDVTATLDFSDGRQSSFTIRRVGWVATRPAGEF